MAGQELAQAEQKGLKDVIAATTALSYIDGEKGELYYRGIPIQPLVEQASFEEVSYLLWYGELPDRTALETHRRQLAEARPLPPVILDMLRTSPAKAHPMDALRTAVSTMGLYDPDVAAEDEAANRRKATRLTAQMATAVGIFHRLRQGKEPPEPKSDQSHAANLLYLLTGEEPGETAVRVIDAYLVMLADHGLNASTFSARVTTSTLADMHAAITSAIGTLKGRLHGGANQRVMEMLEAIGNPERTDGYVRDLFARGERVMGFGHRVYKVEDPRATILRRMSEEIADAVGDPRWHAIAARIEEVVHEVKPTLPVNVDFYSAPVLHNAGIPTDLFTPLFALSRIAGWAAHILEQRADNRLIRPRARYVGEPGRPFIPLSER